MLEWQAHSEAGAQKETVSYGVMYFTGTHTSHTWRFAIFFSRVITDVSM